MGEGRPLPPEALREAGVMPGEEAANTPAVVIVEGETQANLLGATPGVPKVTEEQNPNPAPAAERVETYDRAYWTPDRIRRTVADFFVRMEKDDKRRGAEMARRLKEAEQVAEARRLEEKARNEQEYEKAEEERRQRDRDLRETERQRHVRHTIELMQEMLAGESSHRDLALGFLSTAAQTQDQSDEDSSEPNTKIEGTTKQ